MPTYDQVCGLCKRNIPSPRDARRKSEEIWKNVNRPGVIDEMRDGIQQQIAGLFSASSIASFFRDPLNSRYWSDYADRDRGWGALFDLTYPWTLEAHMGEKVRWPTFEVQYVPVDERPIIELDFSSWHEQDGFKAIEKALLTKADVWREQREERFIRVGVPEGLVRFPQGALRAVILGSDIEEDRAKHLQSLAKRRRFSIPVFQARHSREHYAMELVPVL